MEPITFENFCLYPKIETHAPDDQHQAHLNLKPI